MSDIGVYTTLEKLGEKITKTKGLGWMVWWDLCGRPGGAPPRIYFAANGRWQGYFTCFLSPPMRIHLKVWHPFSPEFQEVRSAFRGFTYKTPRWK